MTLDENLIDISIVIVIILAMAMITNVMIINDIIHYFEELWIFMIIDKGLIIDLGLSIFLYEFLTISVT